MVIPNFFITFVRHSFHTSHPPAHPLSRETASPCTTLPPDTTLPSCTRAASRIKRTRLPHALHLARAMPHAPHTRYAPTPSVLPPPRKELRTRATHTLCILALTAHTPAKGYATHAATNAPKAPLPLPPPLLSEKKARAP